MKYLLSAIQKIREVYLRKFPDQGKVLMFHQVNNNMGDWIDKNVAITCDSFKILIERLIGEEAEFGTVDEIANTCISKKIYITFDDGFSDIYFNAYPILKKYSIPFCIFITTNYVNENKYLSQGMLRELSLEPLCTIGAHTLSHPLLRFEDNSNSFNEISKSKHILEEIIEREVNYFAFPYGSIYACSKKDIINAHKAGYKIAFSTINSHLSEKAIELKYFMPRINVNEENHKNVRS